MSRALRWDITGDTSWLNFSNFRTQALLAGEKLIVQRVNEARTLDQNALSHALYTQIAGQLEDQAVAEVRAECKLRHGIPILRGDDSFRELYDKVIKPHDYETKLKMMGSPFDFPVTSLMDKKQFSEYVDVVIREYSKQGVSIVMPGEE